MKHFFSVVLVALLGCPPSSVLAQRDLPSALGIRLDEATDEAFVLIDGTWTSASEAIDQGHLPAVLAGYRQLFDGGSGYGGKRILASIAQLDNEKEQLDGLLEDAYRIVFRHGDQGDYDLLLDRMAAQPERIRTYAGEQMLWWIIAWTGRVADYEDPVTDIYYPVVDYHWKTQIRATELLRNQIAQTPKIDLQDLDAEVMHDGLGVEDMFCLARAFGGDEVMTREEFRTLRQQTLNREKTPPIRTAKAIAAWLIANRSAGPTLEWMEDLYSNYLLGFLHVDQATRLKTVPSMTSKLRSYDASFGNVGTGDVIPDGMVFPDEAARILEILVSLRTNPEVVKTMEAGMNYPNFEIQRLATEFMTNKDAFGRIAGAKSLNKSTKDVKPLLDGTKKVVEDGIPEEVRKGVRKDLKKPKL